MEDITECDDSKPGNRDAEMLDAVDERGGEARAQMSGLAAEETGQRGWYGTMATSSRMARSTAGSGCSSGGMMRRLL